MSSYQSEPFRWPAFVCAVIEQARDGYWVALLGAVVFAGVLHVVLSP